MAARITLHNPRLAAHCSYRSTSDRTGAWRPIGRRTCNVASDPFVTRRGRRRGLRAFRLILVASNGSSLVRSPIWTTALLGLGEALDDDNVGQLGELVRVEQQFARAIAATHNHPGLLHDRTVDVDGQITNAKRSDPTDHHACEVHGGLFVGEGETLNGEQFSDLLVDVQPSCTQHDACGVLRRGDLLGAVSYTHLTL